MFKKVNKTMSLLMAAAAVISVIPSNANALTKETKSKDGDIYNAIAYKDGNFYIGGEPEDKDDAAYYLSNGKYKELDDISSDDKAIAYGNKYVEIDDGNYYLDLTNGKISDDEIKDKDLDDVAVNLRSKIKYDNDGRFDSTDVKEIKDVTELPKAKFSDGWYETEYTIASASSTINGGATSFNVYTDASGKYIDADYNLGKVKVKLSDSKTATISNTSDASNGVRGSVSDTTVIGQDSNNIYRLATITIESTNGSTISAINDITLSSATTAFTLSSDETSVSFEVIQVISKAQSGSNIDGIKYAKTVTDYPICDKSGKKEELLSSDEDAFTVASGILINYKIDGDDLEAATVQLKNKSSIYYVDLGDSDDVTLQDDESSVDVDADGNLWALSDENILQFDTDGSFKEVYDTDEEYKDLSVYDKDNIVVWSADDDIYSIISKASSAEDDSDSGNTDSSDSSTTDTNSNTTTNTNTVKAGWSLNNGKWSYNNADGSMYKGWLNNSGAWYYLDVDGIMSTGWKYVDGKWYFLDGSSGAMKTGWINDNGTWYYLNSSGAMLSNTTINGYKLGANGAWVK